MEYFAFGETFIEEHKNSHNAPYKYNGKELDEESGLYYYGARYYDSRLSLMISVDQLTEKFAGRSPYEYCFNNPINQTDPTGMGPEDPPAKNIIINFLRGENNGKYDNKDFSNNGWKIIDATDIKDASAKLKSYLGDEKANNIFLNAHGGVSEYYKRNEKGYSIPDESNPGQYLKDKNSGIKLGTTNDDWIMSNEIGDYNSDVYQKFLSAGKIDNIKALIEVGGFVKERKNLIFGSCNTAMDDNFGSNMTNSLTTKIDTFVNKDYTSNYLTNGKITFSNFTNYSQTTEKNYKNGWRMYNSESIKTFRNLKFTKYGVKIVK